MVVNDEKISADLSKLSQYAERQGLFPSSVNDDNYTTLIQVLYSVLETITQTVEGLPELKYEQEEKIPDKEMKLVLNHMEDAL